MADLLLFRLALRDLLQPKRLLLCAPLVALPAIIATAWRMLSKSSFQPEVAYNTLAGLLVIFTLVLFAAIFAAGVIAQEMEGRTIVYLLTRPMPRARILLAKFLGAVVGIIVTIWISTTLLGLASFGGGLFGQEAFRRDLLLLPVGAFAYGSLFLFLAAALPRPIIWALFFAFGWESWVPLLPGFLRNLSILTYLRVLAPHPNPVEQQNALANLFASLNPATAPVWLAWLVLIGVILGGVGFARLIFSLKEYAPREDAE